MKILTGIKIPETMKALLLPEPKQPLVESERPTPLPSKGEVLVKIDSSPINPADISFLAGTYGAKKPLPAVPGLEAGGQVTATGDDLLSRRLLGRHVACFAPRDGDGAWAQFMRTSNSLVIPLTPGLDTEQGAMLLVNPLTVMAMADIAKKGKHRAVANTAAAGALGTLLNRKCMEIGLPLVNIVSREDQAALLRAEGATHVLASDRDDFDEQLKKQFQDLHVTLAFDAVAGDITAKLLRALPAGGEVMVYGGLSRDPCKANPGELIFRNKRLTGFWLTPWLSRQSLLKQLGLAKQVQQLLMHRTMLIRERVPLSEVNDAVARYGQQMTGGKVLVKPWM